VFVMNQVQLTVDFSRRVFADRLDDVSHMIRQDRSQMFGAQEPPHLRAVLRRQIHGSGSAHGMAAHMAVEEMLFGRGAAEPEAGQQREALGLLLEVGANAVDKLMSPGTPDLSEDEQLALECVVLIYGRPAILVEGEGRVGEVPAFWNVLEDERRDIERVQRVVGRIELHGHPEFDWAGTGLLIGPTCLLTTRGVARTFAEPAGADTWKFRPGISAWLNFEPLYPPAARADCRVVSVIGVHERYDVALLEIEPLAPQAETSVPITLAASAPAQVENRPIYLAGFAVRDARRNESELIARIFRDVYNVKRIQPGTLRGILQFDNTDLLRHDCAMLGRSEGSCVVDLETHQVLGVHCTGRYFEDGTATP
jgi:hypothetical protein